MRLLVEVVGGTQLAGVGQQFDGLDDAAGMGAVGCGPVGVPASGDHQAICAALEASGPEGLPDQRVRADRPVRVGGQQPGQPTPDRRLHRQAFQPSSRPPKLSCWATVSICSGVAGRANRDTAATR